jgi:hypothetical protein
MPAEKLTSGVDTFEPAGWSGSGLAAGGDFEVSVPFRPIKNGLDQSGIVGGINSLAFIGDAEGIVGGGAAGPFIADFDHGGTSVLRNRPAKKAVKLFVRAGGDSGLVKNLDVGGRSETHCQGGKFEDITQDGGRLTLNGSTTSDEYLGIGGWSEHEYNAYDYTSFKAISGEHTLKRAADLIYVGPGAVLIIDVATAFDSAAELVNFGTVIWKNGVIDNIETYMGVMDFSQARGEIAAIGSNKFIAAGTRFVRNPIVDISNAENPAQLGTEVGDPAPL